MITKQKVHPKIQAGQEEVWTSIKQTILMVLKRFLEGLLEDELAQVLEAQRYERTKDRKGYRNGSYKRDLSTWYGLLEGLQVPRKDPGGMDFQVFNRYQRRSFDVEAAFGTLFLSGVSYRKLQGIARDLLGKAVSPSTVSKTMTYLDAELAQFQKKSLQDDIQFLFLDGITQKVREIGVVGKVMLCAFGIHADGRKELLSFRLVDREKLNTWRGFLVDLKSRGLLGKQLRLITTDGQPALLSALEEIYPFVKVQRCMAHKIRNVAVKVKRRNQEACMKGAKEIFKAPNRTEAVRRFKAWKTAWRVEEERAVQCLEKDLFATLQYYDFDQSLWKTIRTTNILERAFREVRRRTRPMGVFTHGASANRIMYGVTKQMNESWGKRPLQEFPQST